ncbi:MAG: hypothetical protein WDN46_20285 [Methylocella sp.]
MPLLTFEIIRFGEAPVLADIASLADERFVWRHVEGLALRTKDRNHALIRVKNSEGQIVVLAGVAIALASIRNCGRADTQLESDIETLGDLDQAPRSYEAH